MLWGTVSIQSELVNSYQVTVAYKEQDGGAGERAQPFRALDALQSVKPSLILSIYRVSHNHLFLGIGHYLSINIQAKHSCINKISVSCFVFYFSLVGPRTLRIKGESRGQPPHLCPPGTEQQSTGLEALLLWSFFCSHSSSHPPASVIIREFSLYTHQIRAVATRPHSPDRY